MEKPDKTFNKENIAEINHRFFIFNGRFLIIIRFYMKKSFPFFVFVVVILTFTKSNQAQLVYDNMRGGIQLSGMLPEEDFRFDHGLKYSYFVRGLLRKKLSSGIQAEFGFANGRFSGQDLNSTNYGTDVYPIDLRILFSPSATPNGLPYLYAGIGGLYYALHKYPEAGAQKLGEEYGWIGIVPVGLGVEFNLNNATSFEMTAGATLKFSDSKYYFRSSTQHDIYYNISMGIIFQLVGDNIDSDADGLSDMEEDKIGTDKKNPDTDGDGISDGDEVLKYFTNPLSKDTDNDGISDYDEIFVYHTDPLKADGDNDGLKDGDEIFTYKTDPFKFDTDGDGISDGDEVLKYHTNPNKVDTDGDGLSDSLEIFTYHTNPLKYDTDGDGLSDGAEVLKYKTNPLKVDTDGDGLSDGDEILKYHTDPLKVDTDGGSVDDGTEVARGTNPLDPGDDVVKASGIQVLNEISLQGIKFKTGSAEILPESESVLDKVFVTLDTYSSLKVEIQGHTDNVGNKESNLKLSLARAQSVKSYLVKKGINQNRLMTKGYGSDKPIASNGTEDGKQKNRRIEFVQIK